MRRVANGLVWAALVVGLPAVFFAFSPSRDGTEDDAESSPTAARGHDPSNCRPCRVDASPKGRPLPYEIDGLNVHSRPGGSKSPGESPL